MVRGSVKFIVYAVVIAILCGIMEYLNNRDNTSKDPGQSEVNYVVRMPAALKYVYLVMFLLGIFLFCVFLFFYLKGNPTVTIGHLRFALIFATIGLAVMIWAQQWRVVVNGTQMEIHKLFHQAKVVSVYEIQYVEVGKKDQLSLYGADNSRLVTIDGLSDNYDRFRKLLRQCGKVN